MDIFQSSSFAKRFWSKVAVGEQDSCWEWQASRRPAGYGQINVDGSPMRAHRVSYLLAHGNLPKVVRHTCDNPPCVNPAHLLPGTQKDNIADAVIRHRLFTPPAYLGEANSQSKLTRDLVREARALHAGGESFHSLARRYAVNRKTITQAVRGERWSHV